MHGQKKKDVKQPSEEEKKKQDEQGQKVIGMINEFLDIRTGAKSVENPNEYCDLLASMCPDLPTIYNFKREVITAALSKTANPKNKYQILANELMLVTKFLKRSPKSYGIWSFRQWLVLECRQLENLAVKLKEKAKKARLAQQLQEAEGVSGTSTEPKEVTETPATAATANIEDEPIPSVVEMELKLCNKMLEIDERNFHCWNYRNWLISEVEKNSEAYIEREIAYTQEKYEKNFSNFSALHFRAKNLERKYQAALLAAAPSSEDSKELVMFKIPLKTIQSELELIKNAIFIQPNEQGVWLYHKWLMGLLTPFRLISAQQTSQTQASVQLTFTCNIRSEHLHSALTLKDSEGHAIKDFSIESSSAHSGIGQVFTVIGSKQITSISCSQPGNPENHIVESQYGKRNAIASEFKFDSSKQLYILEELHASDAQFEQTTSAIVSEELAFVEEIIEAEKNCKFALFHKLFLQQMQEQTRLVCFPYKHDRGIEAVEQILNTIDKLKEIAKKQASVLVSVSSQNSVLLELLKILKDNSTPAVFSIPSNPCYETGILISYQSLLHSVV